MSTQNHYQCRVPSEDAGSRLDRIAAKMFPEYSRGRLQEWIKGGDLLVNGRQSKVNQKLAGGELLDLQAVTQEEGDWEAEDIALDIVFEDDDIMVINKVAGLVVHPGAGNATGTMLNALLHYCPSIREVPRAGIVHRLDKDTSGLMVVAKTIQAQTSLVAQLQARSVGRHYEALVWGGVTEQGTIEGDIGRHPKNRIKMAVVERNGKPAVTHFKRLAKNAHLSHVSLKLETGRTHQIRVHMAHIGFPLVGDPTYGKALSKQQLHHEPLLSSFDCFPRQALHAVRLGLDHPVSGEELTWSVPLAEDIQGLILEMNSF